MGAVGAPVRRLAPARQIGPRAWGGKRRAGTPGKGPARVTMAHRGSARMAGSPEARGAEGRPPAPGRLPEMKKAGPEGPAPTGGNGSPHFTSTMRRVSPWPCGPATHSTARSLSIARRPGR